jgi:hypothetical protein
VSDGERSDLLAQLVACHERLAAYADTVADVTERLGHEGNEPGDLLDALGEIEGMLAGDVTSEPHDLTGLAEQVRQALWHRERARLLLADARSTCDRRAAERDQAILERDAVARELARYLVSPPPPEMIAELRSLIPSPLSQVDCVRALLSAHGNIQQAIVYLHKLGLV